MYVGFGNGKMGVWNVLTPLESYILDEKKVIFNF
jgi:hypothetical protein